MEARLRLVDRDIVLVGVPERARLDVFEQDGDERRPIASLSLARPEELGRLFEALAESTAPPSDAGPSSPFQPPPDEKA
jgi:hypothetical protein